MLPPIPLDLSRCHRPVTPDLAGLEGSAMDGLSQGVRCHAEEVGGFLEGHAHNAGTTRAGRVAPDPSHGTISRAGCVCTIRSCRAIVPAFVVRCIRLHVGHLRFMSGDYAIVVGLSSVRWPRRGDGRNLAPVTRAPVELL